MQRARLSRDLRGKPRLRERNVGRDEPAEREGCLVALEATGHYWRNLFVALLAKGYAVAVLNPLRTRRFAEEKLQRTKTDAIDAPGIARFTAQKRPAGGATARCRDGRAA